MQILTPGVKPQGTQAPDIERIKLCDVNAADPTIVNAEFYRHFVYDATGTSVTSTFDTDLAGAAYTLVGVAAECPTEQTVETFDVETCILCDNLGDGSKPTIVKQITKYDKVTGSIEGVPEYYNLTTGAVHAVAGTIERCPPHKVKEVLNGGESITIDDTGSVSLTVPADAQYAIIQNLTDGAIWFHKDGTSIVANDGSEGFRLDSCGTIKLGCDPQSGGTVDELANFRAIAGAGFSGRLQVCYVACG